MSGSVAGKTQIIADPTAITTGDNIAAYLVDASGTLITGVDVGGNRNLRVVTPYAFAEDSAHVSGDFGAQILGVRNDAGTVLAGDGDYIPFSMDATGRLRVNADFSAAFDFVYDEDSAHVSGSPGAFVLAVRNDTNAAFTSADGDYSPFSVDSVGRVKTFGAGIFAEDAAHTSGDLGQAVWAVRNDTISALAGTSGDYIPFQTNALGELRTTYKSETTILQQVITVGTTAVALPTAALANRKSLMVQMLSSGQLYVGSATVTNAGATRGFNLGNGGFIGLDAGPGVAVFGVANAAAKEVVVLELA